MVKTLLKEGLSKGDVYNSFIDSEYIPLKITETRSSGKKRKSTKAVLELTQMMEQLINSGLSLKDSLEIASQMKGKGNDSANLAKALLDKIKKGNSFAKTINSMPEAFSPVYRGIISVGDRIGSVERIFPRLKTYLETQQKIKEKIKSALLYPSIVLITAIIGMIAMVLFVFPKLEDMFSEFGGDAVTILQQNISNLKSGVSIIVMILIVLSIGLIIIKMVSKNSEFMRERLDKILFHVPLLGSFISQWETLNFAFAMETLTSGGVTIEAAIPEAETVVTNAAYKRALKEVTTDIIKGNSLSDAFSSRDVFPEYMSRWIMVGEKSGQPEHVFSQIRNYYQAEIEKQMNKFMTLIEPALILLIGVFMIILVLTVIVPVFSIYGAVL